MRILLVLLAAVWLALAAPLLAQEAALDPEAHASWLETRDFANETVGDTEATIGALTTLRETLVEWRNRFEAELDLDSGRIAALRAQIEALGPVPQEEGASEPAAIAAERAELEERLEVLLAPVQKAQAAFAEADGLVGETDRRIQDAREEELLRKSPVPLNPSNWPPAVEAMSAWALAFGKELWAPFATPEARATWMNRGAELGIMLFAAVILLWRSGVWLGRLRERFATAEAERATTRLLLLAISLARLILPVIGLVIVVQMLTMMGATGDRMQAARTLVPTMGLVIMASRWLAHQALPARADLPTFVPVAPPRRAEARLHFLTLGVLVALTLAGEVLAPTSVAPELGRAISHFVLLTVAGIDLFRLGQLLLSEGRVGPSDAPEGDSEEGFWSPLLRNVGRALMVVGLAAPIVAAFGYVNLGLAVLWPSVISLGLVLLIGTLQNFVFDAYAAIRRRPDAGRDQLLPTLVGFTLWVASLPLFALIWGVRPTTLGEWWAVFLRGFTLGDTRISPVNFLSFILIFALGYLVVGLVKNVLRTSVLPKTQLDAGGTNAILSGTSYVGITLAALIGIVAAGIDLSALAVVAGALSIGIGFGLQTIVQNFVSGIILLIERPIKIGDWVQAGATEGFVREISVRSTRIETFDRQDVIVPNADLISGVVTNYTLNNASGRVVLQVGVAYGTDTIWAQSVLQEVAEAHPMVVLNPPPLVTFDAFGADSLNFTIRVVIRDILFKPIVASELNHALAKRFREEGIEVPFAQRDIWLRNPEALQPRQTGAETE
ncbi:DUF3772 domain-containing protein [uncultured Jannaschia sp.]|uniref:DUF3772 domain-containing protein n=1 Tax=uncultured Jannaschia sp. TaxID=293347 RepID=UPI00261A5E73|nr:DUF3772 domain-containing protein [uncultured Jannaschia sp.]